MSLEKSIQYIKESVGLYEAKSFPLSVESFKAIWQDPTIGRVKVMLAVNLYESPLGAISPNFRAKDNSKKVAKKGDILSVDETGTFSGHNLEADVENFDIKWLDKNFGIKIALYNIPADVELNKKNMQIYLETGPDWDLLNK